MTDQSATSIEITWERPDNGGTPLTTYTIYSDQATNGVTFTEIIASTGLVTTYVITDGIVTDSIYQFKVLATNVLGNGELSDASDPIRAASVPDQPDTPAKVSATTSEITI